MSRIEERTAIQFNRVIEDRAINPGWVVNWILRVFYSAFHSHSRLIEASW